MSENIFKNAPELGSALGFAIEDGPGLKCRFDINRYIGMIDDDGYTDEQKEQIVLALCHIGQLFYDAGFGFEVVGQACGQLDESQDDSAAGQQDMVRSEAITLSEIFNQCAA